MKALSPFLAKIDPPLGLSPLCIQLRDKDVSMGLRVGGQPPLLVFAKPILALKCHN